MDVWINLGWYCVFDAGIFAVTVKIEEEPFSLAIAAEILPLSAGLLGGKHCQ